MDPIKWHIGVDDCMHSPRKPHKNCVVVILGKKLETRTFSIQGTEILFNFAIGLCLFLLYN